MSLEIPSNLVCAEEIAVGPEHSAKHVGSGDVEVLSTPSMIAFMEMVALNCVQRYLPDNMTTVGIRVDVKHLNPAPVGSKIVVEAKLVKIEGKKLVFEVRAKLGDTVIGEGVHERYIVDRQRFLDKVRRILSQLKT